MQIDDAHSLLSQVFKFESEAMSPCLAFSSASNLSISHGPYIRITWWLDKESFKI